MIVGLIAAGVLAALLVVSAGASVYFFRTTIVRLKPARPTRGQEKEVGTGPAGMDTATEWDQFIPLIRERKKWLLEQGPEDCFITSRDGLRLHALLLPAAEKTARTVLAVHGYRSDGLAFAGIAPFFHRLGMNVLLVDNRAHGESEGKYVGFGCLDQDDCLLWLDYLVGRFGAESDILLYGVSMGASTVLYTAARAELPAAVRAVVADCAFTSAWEVFRHVLAVSYHLPAFPILYAGDLLCRLKAGYGLRDCSSIACARAARAPILFIHGEEDHFVPTQMSRDGYEACASPKKLLLTPGAGHGSAYYVQPDMYEAAVEEWVGLYINKCLDNIEN